MNSSESPSGRAPSHAFVDESKRRGFSLIRCDVPLTEVDPIRSDLRALLRPGQRRIHFRKESPATRSAVLRVIASYDVHTTVFTSNAPETTARATCVAAAASHAALSDVVMLTLERDESFRREDEATLHAALARTDITWRHLQASQEVGLWIPDAIGWCLDHSDRRWRQAVARLRIELRRT